MIVTTKEDNQRLRSGRYLIAETIVVQPSTGSRRFEASGGSSRGKYRATVSVANTKNGNHRCYPLSEWRRNVTEVAPAMIASGRLQGSCDHGDSARDICLLWKSLEFAGDGRTVVGGFDILPTEAGRNVQAIVDNGGAIALSTSGFGGGHLADRQEQAEYGIDAETTVISEYTINAIDLVKHPSCQSAWLTPNTAAESARRDSLEIAVARMTRGHAWHDELRDVADRMVGQPNVTVEKIEQALEQRWSQLVAETKPTVVPTSPKVLRFRRELGL